jgi:uncharacterized membrane protein
MPQFPKKTTLSIALVSLSILGNNLLISQPANAWTQVCNRTNKTIHVAYARNEELVSTGNVSTSSSEDDPNNFSIKGWWVLNAGACSTVNGGSAKSFRQGDSQYAVRHMVYAHSGRQSWGGDTPLCVARGRFNTNKYIGRQCSGEFYPAGFFRVDTTATNRTVNLK